MSAEKLDHHSFKRFDRPLKTYVQNTFTNLKYMKNNNCSVFYGILLVALITGSVWAQSADNSNESKIDNHWC